MCDVNRCFMFFLKILLTRLHFIIFSSRRGPHVDDKHIIPNYNNINNSNNINNNNDSTAMFNGGERLP